MEPRRPPPSFFELLAAQIVHIQVIALERVTPFPDFLHLYAQIAQEVDEFIDINDVWDVIDLDFFVG